MMVAAQHLRHLQDEREKVNENVHRGKYGQMLMDTHQSWIEARIGDDLHPRVVFSLMTDAENARKEADHE
jgi:hypothetical protein